MIRFSFFAVMIASSIAFAQGTPLPGEQVSEVRLIVMAPLKPSGLKPLARLHEELETLALSRPSVAGPLVLAALGAGTLGAGIGLVSMGWGLGLTLGVVLAVSGGIVALIGVIVALVNVARLQEIERREDELHHQLLLMQF